MSFHLEHIVGLVVEPPVQLKSSLNLEQSSKQPSSFPASHFSMSTTNPSWQTELQVLFSWEHSHPLTILHFEHPGWVKSHSSSTSRVSFPQKEHSVTKSLGVQTHPSSTAHREEHPSKLAWFPSSHSSEDS